MTKSYSPRLTLRGSAAVIAVLGLAAAVVLIGLGRPLPARASDSPAETVAAQSAAADLATTALARQAVVAAGPLDSGVVLADQAVRAPLAVDYSIPVPLATSLIALPLLLLIWLLSIVRLVSIARRLRSGREHAVLAAELGIDAIHLAALDEAELTKLQEKVAFDELTGVMRRAAGLATLEREVARADRRHQPLTVAFIDVDGLKTVNDKNGHAAGDQLLKEVVSELANRLRAEDEIFRYGGDEFCCVLPGATQTQTAQVIDRALVTARRRGQAFSVGIAELTSGEAAADLLSRADLELYHGRAARGQVSR